MRDLRKLIRDVPDFPKPGILFRDITTLLKRPDAFRYVIEKLIERYRGEGIEQVLGIESRGFILGAPLAYELHAGLVPVRKPGKLPAATIGESYDLEYGTDRVEIHADALEPGQKVLIVDDLLATGGTARATANLARKAGANLAGLAFLIELESLKGRERLEGLSVFSLVRY